MTDFVFEPPTLVSIPVAGSQQHFPVRRIYCVGRNYVEHAQEMGFTGREPPFFFCKPTDAIVFVPEGGTGEVPYPPMTKNFHFEAELVVAIGKAGANIRKEDAQHHVFGYAVGLDMTRRDLQGEMKKQGRPWEIGKAFDHSAPIGPLHAVTRTGELSSAAITLDVNGQRKQSSDIAKLIWNVAETIEHLSSYYSLQPGDLIYTGTPEGVGAVVPGDLMVVAIEGLGELKVRVA